MKAFKKSVSVLLTLIMTISLISAVPFTANAADEASAVNNGIPVLNISIDETAEGFGTIEQMNSSSDHSAECTGTIKIDVPDGYKGDYSDVALSDTEELELEYIRGRGHTTWACDKKPYKLKLKKGADLLGMGSNKHWVLLANAMDESMLRNRIVYYIGRKMGLAYTPEMLPVDVVMNGKYLGNYYLTEHVRVGKRRVAIDELIAEDNSEPEVTGGYLFSLLEGNEPEESVFYTENKLGFKFSEPTFYSDDPTEELGTDAQKSYITSYLQKIENAVYGEGFKDENGVSVWDYMDMQSTADYWWVQEFSFNVDAYRSDSTFLYKPRNDKVYWGPLWDFDLALGKSITSPDGFYHSRNIWLDKLRSECPEFQKLLKERWTALDSIITDIVKNGGVLDQFASETKSSWEADKALWKSENYGDFEDYTEALRDILKARQKWINDNIDTKLYKINGAVKFVADGKTVEEKSVPLGTALYYDVPEAPAINGYVFNEWQNEDGSAFENNQTITDDTVITANYISEKELIKADNIYFMSDDVWDSMIFPQAFAYYTLTPFNTNDKVMSWSSSDTSVAEVNSNGTITKKGLGTTVITAELRSGLKKSFNLHVYDYLTTQINEVETLKAEKSSITLNEGEYGHVKVTPSPQPCDTYYYFYSSNESVAEVDSYGVVHALKEGTTTITVESMNAITTNYKVVVKSNKKANPIKVTAKTKSIKAKKLKAKAQTVKPLTISKAQGKVSVKTSSVKLGKKKISVKKFKLTKTGKLIVKKGKYKKGTYKITAKITVKGNSKYKPKTVTKAFKIRIVK